MTAQNHLYFTFFLKESISDSYFLSLSFLFDSK